MTSETEVIKTNEFLRRRKLRIQQVREQSKEIAKKVRQRVNVEKIQQIGAINAKKEKEYLQHQDKLVRRLGHLYTKGLQNVGLGHQNAAAVNSQGDPVKEDLSKQRGRDAAAELRRKKQEKLDEHKKQLDRKLLARATANDISREKSTNVTNKLLPKQLPPDTDDLISKPDNLVDRVEDNDQPKALRSHMATQWDFDQVPNEWEPNVPELNLPKEDSIKSSPKKDKSERLKKLNLFALSDEMPSSLRGGLTSVPEQPESSAPKPSVTLISEYLQNRDLRLRESDVSFKNKKSDELVGIKQTIQRTRASKNEAKFNAPGKSKRESDIDCALNRKDSVMIYNHSTRDARDVPFGQKQYVSREIRQEEDAYSQAMRESSIDNDREREHQKKLQEMRNKIAMTKQTVEKEYKDTMAFLNTFPKDKSKPIRNAYMDEQRQQMLKESRQRKMQYEFKQIEKECKKNAHKRQVPKSPVRQESENDFNAQDFQYSWMPVPDSDSNFAIHTIPTTLKKGKTGNTVKFSKVDSYHEYRSRHKHTPPTKDTGYEWKANNDESENSTESSSTTSDSSSSENLQQNEQEKTVNGAKEKYSDAERIIIYKILDSKSRGGKDKVSSKLLKDIAQSLTLLDKEKKYVEPEPSTSGLKRRNVNEKIRNAATRVSFEQLNEGVYRAVNNNNGENIASLNLTDSHRGGDLDDGTSNACTCGRKERAHGTDRVAGPTSNQDCDNVLNKSQPETPSQGSKCPHHGNETRNKQGISNPIEFTDAASATSFKTARNEKVMLTENNFVKLLDDGGVDSGKFYIGASGVLKNDNYEVVIHLRKKDQEGPKESVKETCDRPTSPNISKSDNPKQSAPASVTINTEPELKSVPQDAISISSEPQSSPGIVIPDRPYAQNVQHISVSSGTNENESPKDYFVEKVDKPTQRDCANGIIDELAPRSGVSACTQTSLRSPETRRPPYHMSSSTSTAYMSPPDMILPPYLKHGRKDREQIPNSRVRKESTEYIDHETFCEKNSCRCKRCTHARKVVVNKIKPALANYENVQKSYKIWQPPPNTERSSTSEIECDMLDDCDKKTPSMDSSHTKRKLRRRQGDRGSACCVKNHFHKRHSSADNKKRMSRNLLARVHSDAKTSNKTSPQFEKNVNRINMNPVIKTYIDKLLQLNKCGMKTVDILNQDCSEITTPGSSVIDVPRNTVGKPAENKISLKDIKDKLTEQIIEDCIREQNIYRKLDNSISKPIPRFSKKKSLHKVKSLNISKHLLKTNQDHSFKSHSTKPSTKSPIKKHDCLNLLKPTPIKPKIRSKSSPSPRRTSIIVPVQDVRKAKPAKPRTQLRLDEKVLSAFQKHSQPDPTFNLPGIISSESDAGLQTRDRDILNSSTQTQHVTDEEIHFMKLAENKIQNMEKIADLTEKCTKRLSNLAKVLEEVRKNKSIVYSQISDSESDRRSDRNIQRKSDTLEEPDYNRPNSAKERSRDDLFLINKSDSDKNAAPDSLEPRFIIARDSDSYDENTSPFSTDWNNISKPQHELPETPKESISKSESIAKEFEEKVRPTLKLSGNTVSLSKTHLKNSNENVEEEQLLPSKFMDDETSSSTCDLFLKDIPKPSEIVRQDTKHVESVGSLKHRGRPPPALSRVHLKHAEDLVPPHELSTVVEVDSPLSVKMKSARNNRSRTSDPGAVADDQINPDLLQSNFRLTRQHMRTSLTDSSDDSKLQMMDLKKFNDIMLKPFMSIQEYAKQCNIEMPDEVSNIEDATKPAEPNDELSSARSDSSLPDVISELLKRKIISEPFKFDSTSTANSTTMSSDSTTALALSKVKRDKKKSSILAQNKENVVDTSDTLSISSNPDLENAFKKLGMGWASSTLKKTKERLALSSSSNTSSSSLTQFKIKSFSNNDIPLVVSDSVSSAINFPKKSIRLKNSDDCSKNIEQQTSKINSMTVKEFLTTELAKKITFNKSYRDDSEEFVSLYETKMPEQMKHSSLMAREPSIGSQRARTSTPVQLFKSLTYHSTSSSNVSGIFSNAEELSSVKGTSNSVRNNSTSDKDDLTIPNYSLKMRKGFSDCSKSE